MKISEFVSKFTGSLLMGNSFPIPVIPLYFWVLRCFSVSTCPSWDAHIPPLLPDLHSWYTKARGSHSRVSAPTASPRTCCKYTMWSSPGVLSSYYGAGWYISIQIATFVQIFSWGNHWAQRFSLTNLHILRMSHLMLWSPIALVQ